MPKYIIRGESIMLKKYVRMLIVVFLGSFVLFGCNQTENPKEEQTNNQLTEQPEDNNGNLSNKDEIVEMAETYISLLVEGEYEEAVKYFDEQMKEQLTPEALEETWETLLDQTGNFIDQEFDSVNETDDGHQVVLIKGLFEATDVTFTVTFDEDQQIAGFYIQ